LSLSLDMKQFDEKSAKEQLHNIVNVTKHLSYTIDDFRNFYKIDKSKIYFSMAKTIEKCLSILNASLYGNNINVILNLEEDLEYYGLENELMQAILNILSNSKDALLSNIDTHHERYVFIDLYKTKDEESITLIIKDNGNGIPQEIMPKIFDQNFTTKENQGGTGIGLFMTKEIIEKHMHASIEVSNCAYMYKQTKHKGAKFVFVFDSNS